MRSLLRCAGFPCGVAFAMFLATWGTAPSSAYPQQPGRRVTEHELIAAYVYHFTLYFTWPKGAFPARGEPFVIGIFGQDPIADELGEVARRKTVQGRRIEIHRFQSWDNYRPCHILFLPRVTGQDNLQAAVKRTRRTPSLIVGETPGSARRGADVNFYPDVDGTIGFEINVDTVAARRLVVAAKLLKLAKVVRNPPRSDAGG